MMISDFTPSINIFIYSHLVLSQMSFNIIILLLCKFKVYKNTQIQKKMLLHSKLLWLLVALFIKYVWILKIILFSSIQYLLIWPIDLKLSLSSFFSLFIYFYLLYLLVFIYFHSSCLLITHNFIVSRHLYRDKVIYLRNYKSKEI